MAYTKKWIREYEITFSGKNERLVVSSIGQRDPLDISFNVKYDPEGMSQGTMALSVFGLKESNVAILMQSGVKVWLKVGYRDSEGDVEKTKSSLKLIYTGDIRAANVDSTSTKHETKIKCISSRVGNKPIAFTFPATGTNAERIVRCLDRMTLSVPELSIDRAITDLVGLASEEPSAAELAILELEDRTLLLDPVIGSLTVIDVSIKVLNKMLATFNIYSTIVNDEIYLVRKGGRAKEVNVINAELGSNLLTPPRRRLDNMNVPPNSALAQELYEFTMLLEPDLAPNSIIALSHIRTDFGSVEPTRVIVKATEVSHVGKYRGNAWHTMVAGAIDDDFLHRGPIVSVVYDMDNTFIEPKIGSAGVSFLA